MSAEATKRDPTAGGRFPRAVGLDEVGTPVDRDGWPCDDVPQDTFPLGEDQAELTYPLPPWLLHGLQADGRLDEHGRDDDVEDAAEVAEDEVAEEVETPDGADGGDERASFDAAVDATVARLRTEVERGLVA